MSTKFEAAKLGIVLGQVFTMRKELGMVKTLPQAQSFEHAVDAAEALAALDLFEFGVRAAMGHPEWAQALFLGLEDTGEVAQKRQAWVDQLIRQFPIEVDDHRTS